MASFLAGNPAVKGVPYIGEAAALYDAGMGLAEAVKANETCSSIYEYSW